MITKHKKLYALILLLVVSISVISVVSVNLFSKNIKSKNQETSLAFADINSNELKKVTNKSLEEQLGANYESILSRNADAVKLAENIDLNFQNQKSNEILYPNYFGGKYVDDNSNLIVQIVKNYLVDFPTILTNDKISIEYVLNSYNDLENVNNEIINYFAKNGVSNSNIVANYVDVLNNNVVVELENNTIEEQTWFENNVVESSLIKFVKTEKVIQNTATYNAGGSIAFCSIGYRAKMNGNEGFITAAHCFSGGLGTTLGSVEKSQYSGSIDAAFVKLYSGNYITNTLQNGYYPSTTLNTNPSLYPNLNTVGTFIAKSGITTGATTGKITNTNYSYNSNGVYLSGFIQTNAKCNNGDSGGVVYKPGTSSSKEGTVLGVVHAKIVPSNQPNIAGDMIYSRSDLIHNAFGLTRY